MGAEHLSPWLVECTVRLGTWMPFERVPAALAFFTGVGIDADTARRLTEAAGRALDAVETAAVERLEQDQPDAPVGPAVQQVSADGAMVPLLGGKWGEVRTLVVGSVVPAALARAEDGVHARDLSYFSRLADAETFTRLAWGELYRRGTPRAGVVAGVMDGADWLQGFLDDHRPDAVRILDFPHGVEHLAMAAHASLGTDTAASRCWLAQTAHALKHGEPAAVLAAVCSLPTALALDPAAAVQARDQTVAYLAKRWDQIQYAQFQAHGYPIGSGAVESANKLVVEARLKGSGMHWARANVNPLLALRSAACSDRWEEAWPRLCQQRREQAAAKRRDRWLTNRRARLPVPVPEPAAAPQTPTRQEEPARQRSARPRLIVNGRPTAQHPWKRVLLLSRHRQPGPARAKL